MTDIDVETAYVTTSQHHRDKRLHVDRDCIKLDLAMNVREIDPEFVDWPICKVCTGTAEQSRPDFGHFKSLQAAAEGND